MVIKNKHQQKLLMLFLIGGIIVISAIIYVCSFNSYIKGEISKTHQASKNNAENVTTSLNTSAAWLLNDADVLFILNSYTDYDVLRTGTAQSSVQMITTLEETNEIYFIKKNQGIIYSSNSMFPEKTDDFLWHDDSVKSRILQYCAEDMNAFFASNDEIYYVCNNNRNIAVIYTFKQKDIQKRLFSNEENSFVYYNDDFLCANDSKNKEPNIDIGKYSGNGNVVFKGTKMYICDKYNYFAYVTVMDYKILFVSLFKNTFYIYAIIILIIAAVYFALKGIINIMEKNNNNSMEFYGRELLDRTILKLFLNSSIYEKEMNMLNSVFKANVTPVLFYVDIGDEECSESERWSLTYGVCNILTELFGNSKFICYSLCIGVGLVSEKSADSIEAVILEARNFIKKNFKVNTYFVVGMTYKTVDEAVMQINKPSNIIDNIYLCNSEQIVYTEDRISSDEWQRESSIVYDKLMRFVKLNDIPAIKNEFLHFIQLAYRYNAFEVKGFVIKLFLDIFNAEKDRHSDWRQYEVLNEFMACQTLTDSIGYIESILTDDGIQKQEQNIDEVFKLHVETIIEQYYNIPDFNLAYLAEIMNMNKTYLGRKFVSVFQENFSQYIAEFRINKACVMLKNISIKVEDIAAACGFSSASYFIKVFKKYKGITPIEYRETITEDEND